MTAHELMVEVNHRLIRGEELKREEKTSIVRRLLQEQSTPEQAWRFYRGVNYPGNTDSSGRQMYPVFYIPPYNGGNKLKTVLDALLKTHILSANMYELEILRLLFLFAPDNPEIKHMIDKTLERLKTACFAARDDGVGECFDASLIVLRFLAAVSQDRGWMQSRIDNFHAHYKDKRRAKHVLWYFWLCLSELPLKLAAPEIVWYKREMIPWLSADPVIG